MPDDAKTLPLIKGQEPKASNLPFKNKEATPPSQMPPPLKIMPGESSGEFAKRKQDQEKRKKVAVQRQALK